MTPANIVHMAKLKNLDVIAVTDHNSCKNCPAVLDMAERNNIVAIPGMELCTMEEVHVLCLFTTLEDALRFDSYVSERLMKIPNDEMIFGKQELYDTDDKIIGYEPYLLINATDISFDDLESIMKEFQGIYIPAHIDKSSNSLLSNLGFIPPESKFSCVEIMDISKKEELKNNNPYLTSCLFITNSDAHTLEKINEPIHYLQAEDRSISSVLQSFLRRIV